MSPDLWIHLVISVLGWGIVLGMAKAQLQGHDRRLQDLERRGNGLAVEFVPRLEIDAKLEGIRSTAEANNRILTGLYKAHIRNEKGIDARK